MTARQSATARTAAVFTGLLMMVVWIGLGLRASDADGVAANVIGESGRLPKPSCPATGDGFKDCNAFGHVTGFQVSTDGERAVMKAKEDGKIVAWGVNTSVPEKDPFRDFFEENLADQTFDKYGGKPTAGISILKEKGKGRFALAKKSPIVELDSNLGRNPIFTLKKPLKIKKGRIVALTTPTWVTNFALADPKGKSALSDDYKWRASRKPDRCLATRDSDGNTDNSNLTELSHPQVKKGSIKKYGCTYTNADILYRAYYVPDKK